MKRQSSGRGYEGSWLWKLFLMEAVHYNIPVGNVLAVSPYASILSVDTRIQWSDPQDPNSSPDTTTTPLMLSTGLGLSVKVFYQTVSW